MDKRMVESMVGRGRFAMVQHNQLLCTRPGFGLRFTANTWFLGTAKQPSAGDKVEQMIAIC